MDNVVSFQEYRERKAVKDKVHKALFEHKDMAGVQPYELMAYLGVPYDRLLDTVFEDD